MNKTFFNPEENQSCVMESEILSAFRKHKEKPSQIQQGMSPDEIAYVVSEHLISVIKEQFANAKKSIPDKS